MDLQSAIEELRRNPQGIRFSELEKICTHYFGSPRSGGTSHLVYKMAWAGDPRVNIQNDKGMAKTYQVRQVIRALERLQEEHDN